MTTETLSLMGNSLGHPLLDVRVDVRRLQFAAVTLSSRPIVKCKRQTVATSQTSSYVSRKSFNINRQVSVVKQGVSIRSFRYFE